MPKYPVCGGDGYTLPGQGMHLIPGCLFPCLWTIFTDLGCIFLFLAETFGLPMLQFLVYDGDSWAWPRQGMGTIPACLFLVSGHQNLPSNFRTLFSS